MMLNSSHVSPYAYDVNLYASSLPNVASASIFLSFPMMIPPSFGDTRSLITKITDGSFYTPKTRIATDRSWLDLNDDDSNDDYDEIVPASQARNQITIAGGRNSQAQVMLSRSVSTQTSDHDLSFRENKPDIDDHDDSDNDTYQEALQKYAHINQERQRLQTELARLQATEILRSTSARNRNAESTALRPERGGSTNNSTASKPSDRPTNNYQHISQLIKSSSDVVSSIDSPVSSASTSSDTRALKQKPSTFSLHRLGEHARPHRLIRTLRASVSLPVLFRRQKHGQQDEKQQQQGKGWPAITESSNSAASKIIKISPPPTPPSSSTSSSPLIQANLPQSPNSHIKSTTPSTSPPQLHDKPRPEAAQSQITLRKAALRKAHRKEWLAQERMRDLQAVVALEDHSSLVCGSQRAGTVRDQVLSVEEVGMGWA